MNSKRICLSASLLCFAGGLFAAPPQPAGQKGTLPASNQTFKKKTWYGVVGSGYAWSMKAGIHNPQPSFWDASDQGYNSDLGDSPFFTIGFGKRIFNLLCIDLDYTYYQTFHYQKFQTGTSDTPGFTGSARTRFFDLDNQNAMANFSLYPDERAAFPIGSLRISPFVGIGIGVGINRVSNFHTVAFDATSQTGSTTSIGKPVTSVKFAWQAMGGLRFHPRNNRLNFDIGYRYYDGGRFKCPGKIQSNTAFSQGLSDTGKPWKGRLRANELTLTLNFPV